MEIKEKESAPIAVSFDDGNEFGCPYCGYRSGFVDTRTGNCAVWECGACHKICILLGGGLKKSTIGLGKDPVYPVLQKHPRYGIPAHGNEDIRPDTGGEFFQSRGIGLDGTPGCFICGGGLGLYNNIAAYVWTKESGERVVAMFETGARLDYREHQPDGVQVKIGGCNKHKPNLETLDELCEDGVITEEKIAEAKK